MPSCQYDTNIARDHVFIQLNLFLFYSLEILMTTRYEVAFVFINLQTVRLLVFLYNVGMQGVSRENE